MKKIIYFFCAMVIIWGTMYLQKVDAYAGAGDSQSEAIEMNLNEIIRVSGKNVWYKFTTTGNESFYRFSLSERIGEGVDMELSSSDGSYLATLMMLNRESCSHDIKLKDRDIYYVHFSVPGYSGADFKIEEIPDDTPDTKAEAKKIELRTSYMQELETQIDEDWYRFKALGSNALYRLQVSNLSIPSGCKVTVYKSNDVLLKEMKVLFGDIVYYDVQITDDSEYYFVVEPYSSYDSIGQYQIEVDYFEIEQPTQISSSPINYNSNKVSWVKADNADGYEIQYSIAQNTGYQLLGTTSDNIYTHTGADTGRTYYYKIRAYRIFSGNKYYSNFTNPVNAKAEISSPSNLKAVQNGTTSIKISWTKSTTSAAGYEIWYAQSKNGTYKKVADVTSTNYTHNKLNSATTYYYKAKAKGSGTNSEFTSTASATTKPAKITNLKAISSSITSNKLTWKKSANVTGYEIRYATSKKGTYKKLVTTTKTTYTHKKLTTGKAYYYKIRAYKKVENTTYYSDYTSIKSAKPVPAKPGSVKAKKSGSKNAVITWKKVSGVNGYVIYRSTSKKGSFKKVGTVKSSKKSFTNKKLTKGTIYYYKIRAYKTVKGKKIYSSYSTAVKVKR